MTIRRSFIVLITILLTLLAILAGATSADAQRTEPAECPGITYITLVKESYTEDTSKCVYSGQWDVFMGWPNYSPYFFCYTNQPDGMIVLNAVEKLNGNVKCVWIIGSETPEQPMTVPATFRGSN